MRVHVGHILLVRHPNKDGFPGQSIVEAVHVQEMDLLFIGLLQLAEAKRTETELVLLVQDQSVKGNVSQLKQNFGFDLIVTGFHPSEMTIDIIGRSHKANSEN